MPSRGGKEVVNPQEAEGQEAREVVIQGGDSGCRGARLAMAGHVD